MRIFVDPAALVAGELVVRGDEHHYLAHVRRARPGDSVELVDGGGRRAAARIVRIAEGQTTLHAGRPEQIASQPPFVRALVPLIKGDRMESCIEKLVEVGADAITVWPAVRSVARLDDSRREARIAKFRDIAKAAARQSGRAQVPEVTSATSLTTAIARLPYGRRLVLDPTSDTTLDISFKPGGAQDVTVISGPEGGLAPEELERLTSFTPLGLGPRVLRAETAPMVAVALIRAATRS
jgi:16S rRNA (uracil1498-N3)-methyltransferase